VETSNYNVPGIACYRKLGFDVCGFDLSLCHGTPRGGEFAVYLWKPLAVLPSRGASPGRHRADP
jgi:hypothetical protein